MTNPNDWEDEHLGDAWRATGKLRLARKLGGGEAGPSILQQRWYNAYSGTYHWITVPIQWVEADEFAEAERTLVTNPS